MLTIDKRKRVEEIDKLLYELTFERARLLVEIKESDEWAKTAMEEAAKIMCQPFIKENK